MTKIYKVEVTVYDFLCHIDRNGWKRDGWKQEDYYFFNMDKANVWIEEHKYYAHMKNSEIADKEWFYPNFKVKEIEVA